MYATSSTMYVHLVQQWGLVCLFHVGSQLSSPNRMGLEDLQSLRVSDIVCKNIIYSMTISKTKHFRKKETFAAEVQQMQSRCN